MSEITKLGRYDILAELGRGAMGVVYKAIDPNLDRLVAIKTVKLDLQEQEGNDFLIRFQREAKSAGRLAHPNIVTIYDVGQSDNIAYIAMEFLDGESLREILNREHKLPAQEVADYGAQLADALGFAHQHQVVHRDIKPANVVRLRNGRIKLADFGIAQMPSGHLTQTGTVLGTPKYMSPEQVRGMRVDGRSDIFSLGVVLYEMLTGTSPFLGSTVTATMFRILNDAPTVPLQFNPGIPNALCLIIARCLAKEPQDRYQTAEQLAHDLRHDMEAPCPAEDVSAAFAASSPTAARQPVKSRLQEDEDTLSMAAPQLTLPPVAGGGETPVPAQEPHEKTLVLPRKAAWQNLPVGAMAAITGLVLVGSAAGYLAGTQTTDAAKIEPTSPSVVSSPLLPATTPSPAKIGQETPRPTGPVESRPERSATPTPDRAAARPARDDSNNSTAFGRFWRKQKDCIRRGNCEPAQQPNPHQVP